MKDFTLSINRYPHKTPQHSEPTNGTLNFFNPQSMINTIHAVPCDLIISNSLFYSPQFLHIYTDAFKTESHPQFSKFRLQLHYNCLHSRTYCHISCIQTFPKIRPPFRNILIVFHSKAAIQHITKSLYKRKVPPIIVFTRNILQYLMHVHKCKINFIWMLGYLTKLGNE